MKHNNQSFSNKKLKILPIEQIRFDPEYVIRDSAKEARDLMLSVEEFGIMEPLIVARVGHETFAVIDGHRRLRAANKLGWQTVPCIVHPPMKPGEAELLRFRLHDFQKPWTEHERREGLKKILSNSQLSDRLRQYYLSQLNELRVSSARPTSADRQQ